VEDYYSFSRDHGASRLVITGGGEPLLRPDVVVDLISRGSKFFDEIACFTNGTYLTRDLSKRLADAGLSYICYSRHSDRDDECKVLMGETAPTLYEFFEASQGLKVRATCVMARGYIDSAEAVWRYIGNLEKFGVTEFTFKHTYVAYGRSIFKDSPQDDWARKHQVEFDPFTGIGEVVATLPWGPSIRRIEGVQVCYYHEPKPEWEMENRICRSINLLSDGKVYASLEDERSLLYRLNY
jgi:cyclic pyranopterin phosphate synthase